MTTEQNKAVVRRFFEAFEANDLAAMKEVLAPDLVAYTHGQPAPTGRDAMLQSVSVWNASFETHYTIDEQIAEGDKVAAMLRYNYTDPETGQKRVMFGTNIYGFREGQISDFWGFWRPERAE